MHSNNRDVAIIFDLDGVISDTQHLHAMVDSKVHRHFGIFLHPDEITDRFAGTGDRRMFSTLFQEYGVEATIEEAIEMKWEMMSELVTPSNIQPVPYSIGLIKELSLAGLRMCWAILFRLLSEWWRASVTSTIRIDRKVTYKPDGNIRISN